MHLLCDKFCEVNGLVELNMAMSSGEVSETCKFISPEDSGFKDLLEIKTLM